MTPHRASDTAVLIARSLLLAERTPVLRPLLHNDCASLTRRLLSAASHARWFEFSLRHAWTRRLLFALERATLPGIFLHYLVRKKRIAQLNHDALQAGGCRQLVVLGAGLDTLAWQQSRQSTLSCFELDHPATQSIKHAVFKTEPRAPALIPADLAHASPTAALRLQPAFDASQPAVFVAEGLLMYLAPSRVSELMNELAAFAAPGSYFIFTFMETCPGRPLAFHNAHASVNTWLRARREPFQWGLSRSSVREFALHHGWRLDYLSSPDELRASLLAPHGLRDAPLALGESIALFSKPLSS
jgi:methyltransferase (TIGR00027 family)